MSRRENPPNDTPRYVVRTGYSDALLAKTTPCQYSTCLSNMVIGRRYLNKVGVISKEKRKTGLLGSSFSAPHNKDNREPWGFLSPVSLSDREVEEHPAYGIVSRHTTLIHNHHQARSQGPPPPVRLRPSKRLRDNIAQSFSPPARFVDMYTRPVAKLWLPREPHIRTMVSIGLVLLRYCFLLSFLFFTPKLSSGDDETSSSLR
ncbi:hypothetical protein F4778DRAFT_736013 [Xylariomycetidae sp. FL2044]|nr:hypothetical protein F4778DRAFT_736013 [Xylariomycetidae sp. FL2044]